MTDYGQQRHDDCSNQTPVLHSPETITDNDNDSSLFVPAIDDPLLTGAEEDEGDVFHDFLDDTIGLSDSDKDYSEDPFGRAATRARRCSEEDASPQKNKGASDADGGNLPPDDPEDDDDTTRPDEVSEQIGKELYELSMQERQRIDHHLHCVPDDKIDDSPERESKALSDLNDWILKHYDTEEAAAYRMAESKNKSIVESRRLRLQFLRGVENYEPERAGKRLFGHFAFRLEYFGESKLRQERITMDDLDKDDLECLKHGFFQFLPLRDSGERGVVVMNCNALQYNTLQNALRAMYYTTMAFYEDDDFQKRGVVMVLLGLQFGNNPRYLGFQFIKQFANFGFSTPTMCLGIHHCLQPGLSASLASWFNSFIPAGARLHTRVHVGSIEENLIKLMSHGIPTQYMPVQSDNNGSADTQWVLQWIEIRKQIDAQHKKNDNDDDDDSSSGSTTGGKVPITVPSPKDILMGRGKRTMHAPGNLRLFVVLDDHYERYEACARHLKYKIAQEMVDLVKSQGCRFLVQVDGFWYEADDVKARDKVSHDFRTIRSSKRAGTDEKDKTQKQKQTKRSRQGTEGQARK